MLIDVHAHLSDKAFICDADEIAEKTAFCEPGIIIDTGADRESSENCYSRAQRYEKIYCVVGIHPEYADKVTTDDIKRIEEMWRSEKTVGIGETGLDYHYAENPDRETQKKAFGEMLELADGLGAPTVIHVRDAHGDTVKFLKENKKLIRSGFLIHCYSGSKELIEEYAKLGGYFSYGGAVTFRNAKDKPEIIRATPRDRIMLETDCPYMTPEPMRGKRNEPSNIQYTAAKVAEILGISIEETEVITTRNAKSLFPKLKI